MKEYSSAFAQAPTSAQWSWPLDLGRYDKDPHIHPGEYAELEKRFQNGKHGHIYPHTLAILHRFAEPILDVLSYIDAKPETHHQTLRGKYLPERSPVLSPVWTPGKENTCTPLPSCTGLSAQSASPNGANH